MGTSHSLELSMNGLVVLAACVCAASGQLLVHPARAINPAQSHQFHAQDEFGQFSFGHAGGPSARTESRNAVGVTTGSYQYVDANGLLQTVNYVADPLNGFRVAGTNLPVGPVAPEAPVVTPLVAPVFDLTGPAPVEDTPEVAAAEPAAEERRKRAAILPYPYAAGAVAAPALPVPNAAITVSAPAAREATLTTVKLNPGHAVSYRVD